MLGLLLAHASPFQVATVLRSPYSPAAGAPAATEPAQCTTSVLTAATAKPGLDGAAKPGAADAVSSTGNGAPPSGDAKDPHESLSEQQQAGMVPAAGDAAPALSPAAAPALELQEKPSPFAVNVDRFSVDSSQAVRLAGSEYRDPELEARDVGPLPCATIT